MRPPALAADRIDIRPMRLDDISAVAAIHERYLRDFLTRMGTRFVRLYYGQTLEFDEIDYVAVLGERVVGFINGTAGHRGFFSRIVRRHPVRVAIAVAPAFLLHPLWGMKRLLAFWRLRQSYLPDGTAFVLFLALDLEANSRGAAPRLLNAFEKEASQRGATQVHCHTERDNARVQVLLRRRGWRPINELFINSDGVEMMEWARTLPIAHGPAELLG